MNTILNNDGTISEPTGIPINTTVEIISLNKNKVKRPDFPATAVVVEPNLAKYFMDELCSVTLKISEDEYPITLNLTADDYFRLCNAIDKKRERQIIDKIVDYVIEKAPKVEILVTPELPPSTGFMVKVSYGAIKVMERINLIGIFPGLGGMKIIEAQVEAILSTLARQIGEKMIGLQNVHEKG